MRTPPNDPRPAGTKMNYQDLTPVFATAPTLKLRARRLREGTEMTHAESLEALAHAYGLKDWNTLAAKAAPEPTLHGLGAGDRIAGHYMSKPFTGVIKGLRSSFAGVVHHIVIRFDEPVDVSKSALMQIPRQQIQFEINDDGITDGHTSDGVPYLVLEL